MSINSSQHESSDWQEQNREYMIACSSTIAGIVEQHLDCDRQRQALMLKIKKSQLAKSVTRILELGGDNNYRLNQLITLFNLSDTETFIILVCMAVELIPSFSRFWATYHGDTHRTYPTFSAIASLFAPFDRRVMAHSSNLEAWKLLRIQETSNLSFSEFPLFIDLDIYNYLLGSQMSDRTIESLVKSVSYNRPNRFDLSSQDPKLVLMRTTSTIVMKKLKIQNEHL